jgi:hypothetical protein
MSFRKKGPNVLVSGALGAAVGLAIVGGLVVLLQIPAQAQRTSSTGAHQDSVGSFANFASQ